MYVCMYYACYSALAAYASASEAPCVGRQGTSSKINIKNHRCRRVAALIHEPRWDGQLRDKAQRWIMSVDARSIRYSTQAHLEIWDLRLETWDLRLEIRDLRRSMRESAKKISTVKVQVRSYDFSIFKAPSTLSSVHPRCAHQLRAQGAWRRAGKRERQRREGRMTLQA